MSGWTIGVLICCFIVALLLLRYSDLLLILLLSLSLGHSPLPDTDFSFSPSFVLTCLNCPRFLLQDRL